MTLFNFPSNFIFWTKIEDHEKLKNILLPKIYADTSKIKYDEDGASITNYFEKDNILHHLEQDLLNDIYGNHLKKCMMNLI